MKQLLTFVFCCFSFFAKAQSYAQDSIVQYPITVYDCWFVSGVMEPGSNVIIAMAKATKGKSDSGLIVYVSVKQSEIVEVGYALKVLQEGISADVNQRLFATILPLCATRPWLASKMIALKEDNRNKTNLRAQSGRAILNGIIDTWNR